MPEEEFEIVSAARAAGRAPAMYGILSRLAAITDRPGFIGQVPLSVLLRRTHTTDNSLRGSPGSRIPRGLIKNSHNVRRAPPLPPPSQLFFPPGAERGVSGAFGHEFFGIRKKNCRKCNPVPVTLATNLFGTLSAPGIDLLVLPSVIPVGFTIPRYHMVPAPLLCPFLAYLTIVNLTILRTPLYIRCLRT